MTNLESTAYSANENTVSRALKTSSLVLLPRNHSIVATEVRKT